MEDYEEVKKMVRTFSIGMSDLNDQELLEEIDRVLAMSNIKPNEEWEKKYWLAMVKAHHEDRLSTPFLWTLKKVYDLEKGLRGWSL